MVLSYEVLVNFKLASEAEFEMVLLFEILSGNNCEDQLSNEILMMAASLQAYQSN